MNKQNQKTQTLYQVGDGVYNTRVEAENAAARFNKWAEGKFTQPVKRVVEVIQRVVDNAVVTAPREKGIVWTGD